MNVKLVFLFYRGGKLHYPILLDYVTTM